MQCNPSSGPAAAGPGHGVDLSSATQSAVSTLGQRLQPSSACTLAPRQDPLPGMQPPGAGRSALQREQPQPRQGRTPFATTAPGPVRSGPVRTPDTRGGWACASGPHARRRRAAAADRCRLAARERPTPDVPFQRLQWACQLRAPLASRSRISPTWRDKIAFPFREELGRAIDQKPVIAQRQAL